jgi:xanthine dehydrogenase small subunit
MDGNICRCTGYKSIERAAATICTRLSAPDGTPLEVAIDAGIIPEYFKAIPKRLAELQQHEMAPLQKTSRKLVAGGTDLYVQHPEELAHAGIENPFAHAPLREIRETNGRIEIGGAVTVTDLMESPLLQHCLPKLQQQFKLVSSTPIRNMATVAGNLVNASPIGDLTIWLLAMNATVVLKNGNAREVPLRDFYQGYKVLDKTADEIVEKVVFAKPAATHFFNFEKVSKRRYLDIATVNTALSMQIDNGIISHARVSAGGVGPVPLFLKNTSSCLNQHRFPMQPGDTRELHHLIQSEIHPIDDVRGSARYKRLLMQQLFDAHLMEIERDYAQR